MGSHSSCFSFVSSSSSVYFFFFSLFLHFLFNFPRNFVSFRSNLESLYLQCNEDGQVAHQAGDKVKKRMRLELESGNFSFMRQCLKIHVLVAIIHKLPHMILENSLMHRQVFSKFSLAHPESITVIPGLQHVTTQISLAPPESVANAPGLQHVTAEINLALPESVMDAPGLQHVTAENNLALPESVMDAPGLQHVTAERLVHWILPKHLQRHSSTARGQRRSEHEDERRQMRHRNRKRAESARGKAAETPQAQRGRNRLKAKRRRRRTGAAGNAASKPSRDGSEARI